MNEYIVRLE